ncbi:nitroreductase family protein [Leuconostoc citreum]|uniref:nitroreductase family protein n=1 Tax=Leuconostoc citreum TaxID=33964 RepID=UPI0032DF4690
MKLSNKYFEKEKNDYKYLIDSLRRDVPEYPGWLQDFAPEEEYQMNFKSEKDIFSMADVVDIKDFWNVDLPKFNLAEALVLRESTEISKLNSIWSMEEILQLMKMALSTGKRYKNYKGQKIPLRNYPSGGAQYPVNIQILMNEDVGFFDKSDNYYVFPDIGKIVKAKRNNLKLRFTDIFASSHYNSSLAESIKKVPMLIVLSINLKDSFEKYHYYAKELAYIELGHVAQNIQLSATALGRHSLPLGGILDDIGREIFNQINDNEFIVYGIACG